MNVIVVYDIEPLDKNPDFRTELRNNGFFKGWSYQGKRYYLPQFSLYKVNTELALAKSDFLKITQKYNEKNPNSQVKVTRLIALPATPWEGIEGDELGI